MDRREALKKLGAGGAVAATAPLVLDGFKVAHALSAGQYPDAGDFSFRVDYFGLRFFRINLISPDVSQFAVLWQAGPLLRIQDPTSTQPFFRSTVSVRGQEFTVSLSLSAGGTTQAYNIKVSFSDPPLPAFPRGTVTEVTKGAFTP